MSKDERIEQTRQRIIARFDEVERDVRGFVTDAYIFRQSMAAIESAARIEPANRVYQYLVRSGLCDLLVGLRRHTDPSSKTRSFVSFLGDLQSHASCFKRDWYCDQYNHRMRDAGLADWCHLLPDNPSALPAQKIDQDRTEIQILVVPLKDVVDKAIAHNDKSNDGGNVVPQDLHDAIAVLEAKVLWYRYLLLQADNHTLLPCNAAELDCDIADTWQIGHPASH